MPATEQAAAVIAKHGSASADSQLLQLVSFVVGTEEYAIPILAVQEIDRMMAITRVPHSPAFVEGVINLRGRIIPVMSLRRRFGLDAGERSKDSRIIVVEVAGDTSSTHGTGATDSAGASGQSRVVGFTVDRVNEVLRIDSSIVEPAPAMTRGADCGFVDGVGKLDDRLLILLNLNKLFSAADLDVAQTTEPDRSAT